MTTDVDDVAEMNDKGAGRPLAQQWIGGKWIDSVQHRDSIDPSNGEVIGRYAMGVGDDAQKAIAAALEAFRETTWRSDRELRARVLSRMADCFEAHLDELVEILGLENGKIHRHGRTEVSIVPDTLRFNAALALTGSGRASQIANGDLGIVIRQPVGVAGIIVPWNSPVALGIRSLAPALAAGATAVMSAASQTAQTNALVARIISQVEELPPGVVNVITGGRETGDTLVRSPHVPVISFTGSTATGKAISANASDNLKRLGLELGGKAPMIVFGDADLDRALPVIVDALTVFAGQFCMTGSRLLVHQSVAEAVRTRLAKRLEALKVGPAADPDSEMGPIVDKDNVDRIDRVVEDAIAAGARVVVRGGPVTEGPLAAGAFYRPTLLEVSDSAMDIVQNEVFGPVLTMQVFDTEEEAIELANQTMYGLSASVFSRDIDRPLRVALALEAGTVWVNDWAIMHDQYEEGGFKASGVGRMRGLAVLDDFLEYKHIQLTPGTHSMHGRTQQ